jgi:hypothetical protein
MSATDGHSQPQSATVRLSQTESATVAQLYTLDVHQAQALFDGAQLPRSLRSIARYCQTSRLDAVTVDGPNGPEWRISEASVTRAIDELKRVFSMSDTASHGEPWPAMSDLKNKDQITKTDPATSPPQSDTVGQGSGGERYIEQLEKRIEEKDDVIGMLRGELAQRNDELVRRNERERETNILIRGLQNLVLQLQPGRSRSADVLQDDPLMTEREVPPPQANPDASPNAV